jgi:hypothetical protein
MNRPAVDRAIIPALAALLYASYTEEVPTEAECDAMRGHVATLKGCIEEYQRRVDELERPAAPDPEAVEGRLTGTCTGTCTADRHRHCGAVECCGPLTLADAIRDPGFRASKAWAFLPETKASHNRTINSRYVRVASNGELCWEYVDDAATTDESDWCYGFEPEDFDATAELMPAGEYPDE